MSYLPEYLRHMASHPKHSSYVWSRQFPRDRLRVLSGIRSARGKWLDSDTASTSAFSRIQIGDTDRRYNVYRSIDGVWEGRDVYFDPVIRPLFIRYAVETYRRALADTLERYPRFTNVEFHDGPLIGERRVIFPDRLDEAGAVWLERRFWELAEKGDVRASESISASFVEQSATVGGRVKVQIEIDLDRPQTDEATWHEVNECLSSGKLPAIDPSPRRCDVGLALGMLREVSHPELIALNWDACQAELSALDADLLGAAKALNLDAMRRAIAAGANPNSFDKATRQTPLGFAVEEAEQYHRDDICSKADVEVRTLRALEAIDLLIGAGAAVDLAAFNETTSLAQACLSSDARVVTRLLEHGADPSINCYDDDSKWDWGTAWEYADFRCNPHVDNDDASAWNALLKFWPAPFDGVRLSEQ